MNQCANRHGQKQESEAYNAAAIIFDSHTEVFTPPPYAAATAVAATSPQFTYSHSSVVECVGARCVKGWAYLVMSAFFVSGREPLAPAQAKKRHGKRARYGGAAKPLSLSLWVIRIQALVQNLLVLPTTDTKKGSSGN